MITASMLYSYTTCPHRVTLDCFGDPANRDEVRPFVELLWERGHAFERETIEALGIPFLNLRGAPWEQREELTLRAMQEGEPLIYGGRISHGRLLGEPDLLRRTEAGYIPGDIKSGAGVEGASEDSDGKPKRHYAVQLALYSDILQQKGIAQSKEAFVWDIHGEEVPYDLAESRTKTGKTSMWDEYDQVLVSVEDIVDRHVTTRPGLIGECTLCQWRSHCRREIVQNDDLTLISELGRSTREKFPPDLATVAGLAGVDLSDLIVGGKSTIPGIGAKTLRKYHARAVLQKQEKPVPYFTEEVQLPVSDTELFFDVETDPFRGLCYLHGFVERTGRDLETEQYVAFFADEAVEEAERDAFAQAWSYVHEHHDAIVYYYSHYERTIWKQLADRYPDVATVDDVTALFEEDRFVDLYSDVVKSRMVWPTTSLSLKTVATFLGFAWRDTDPSGAGSIQWFHQWVETGDATIRQRILDYNEDDCRATRVLVDELVGMAFASVPGESRSQINRAGAFLVAEKRLSPGYDRASDLANRWRACHAYPTNAFHAMLRAKLKSYSGNPISSQRLKRMPSIIEKLARYPAMKLTTMQDIGGVRAILQTPADVYHLVEEYRRSECLEHELLGYKDYIKAPRNEDGYRSVHLVYSYRSRREPSYDNLRIELQIRTQLQHIWAMAVESMGTFLGQALKSRQGDQEWLDFFALVSCAFAHREGTPPVPRFSSLVERDIWEAVAEAERQLNALHMMRGLSVAAYSANTAPGAYYHLIILNSLEQSVDVKAFELADLEAAVHAYGRVEKEAAEGAKLEPVLVAAGDVHRLREAYPSFFLDIEAFSRIVSQIVLSLA